MRKTKEKEMKVTVEPDKLNGTMVIGDVKYIWYINRDYRLVVEADIDGGGDMSYEDLDVLRKNLKKNDPTEWVTTPEIK